MHGVEIKPLIEERKRREEKERRERQRSHCDILLYAGSSAMRGRRHN